MAGNVSGLHVFGPDTGPEALSLLDGNYGALTTALNTLTNFSNSYLDSGAANALVVTVPAPQVFAYLDGVILQVKVAAANTVAAPTINVNGLGLKTIVNPDGSALVAGQLVASAWAALQYEGTSGKFMLVGGGGPALPKLTLGAPAGVAQALTVKGAANAFASSIIGSSTAGQSFGLAVSAGTTSADTAFEVTDPTGATIFLRVRGDGILSLQAGLQPAFNAQRITTTQALPNSTITDLIFNGANTNQAAAYGTGTGIFTAPVTGIYAFSAFIEVQGSGGLSNTINGIYFSKNNATAIGSGRFGIPTGADPPTIGSGVFQDYGGQVILALAANDTLRIKLDNGAGTGGTLALSIGAFFSGYFLG